MTRRFFVQTMGQAQTHKMGRKEKHGNLFRIICLRRTGADDAIDLG